MGWWGAYAIKTSLRGYIYCFKADILISDIQQLIFKISIIVLLCQGLLGTRLLIGMSMLYT